MSQNPVNGQSALMQATASCHQAQAITWANDDLDLCRHMVSLGHSEF